MKKTFNINIPIQHSQLCVGDRIHNELCQLLINATPKNISNDLFKNHKNFSGVRQAFLKIEIDGLSIVF